MTVFWLPASRFPHSTAGFYSRPVICLVWRTALPELVAALTDAAMLARYQEAVAEELPSLADRGLAKHLRRMSTLASRALGSGIEALAQEDVASADELLSDLLAVATFRGWELPLEPLGERELAVEDLPRGLLAADRAADSARVWVIDHETVALARAREVGEVADLSGHPRSSP
jgi:hypothetical protein